MGILYPVTMSIFLSLYFAVLGKKTNEPRRKRVCFIISAVCCAALGYFLIRYTVFRTS